MAGYFSAESYDRKGFTEFIKDRIVRLGAPTLLYMLAIHPFMYYLIDWHNIRTQSSFLEFYPSDVSSSRFLGGTGPLWFALALLIFSIIYALIRVENGQIQRFDKPFSVGLLIKLILLITTSTFVVRFVQHLDTAVLNMQLCYFAQYIILFNFGIHAQRNNWQNELLKKLSDSAFAVYVFHAPILVLLAQAMQTLHLPPFFKFLLLSVVGLPLCFLIAQIIKVVPLFRTITKFKKDRISP